MIRELHAERDLTSVIVTHNERIAVQCDEVWELDAGVFRGIVTEVSYCSGYALRLKSRSRKI